jgi:AcrR family transcriptional regulator
MEAAERVFLAKGYHAATMDDVARAAGMSKKTVYGLIESKAELFAALVEHHKGQLKFPTPEPGWTLHDTLYANLMALARFLLSPSHLALTRVIIAEYTHSPDFGRIFLRNRVMQTKAQLETCLLGDAAAQTLPEAEIRERASMLIGMALGDFHTGALIGYRAPPSRAVLETRVRRAVDVFLAGCTGLTPPSPTSDEPPPPG